MLQQSPVLKHNLRLVRKRFRAQVWLLYADLAPWIKQVPPEFLGIGATRSATTWLHERLSRHPDIYLPDIKEVHFFDRPAKYANEYYFDLNKRSHWRWYWLHFQSAGNRVTGDITPAYAILPSERIRQISCHLPNIRIIYSIRNPVDRAWSGLRHRLWYGAGIRANNLPEDELLRRVMNTVTLSKGDYKANIERWEEYIPPERMLCYFFDDVEQKPRETLEQICRFVGVDPKILPDMAGDRKQVNAVLADDIPEMVRNALCDYYRDQIPWLEDRFKRDLSSWYLV